MSEKMRAMAIVNGKAEAVEIRKPVPAPGEVLVNIVSSSLNPAEEKVIRGDFASRFLHAKTTPLVLGWDFSGTVVEIGEGTADVNEKDDVWGHLQFSFSQNQGAFSEFVTVKREEIALKPEGVPHYLAGAAATPAMTSLQSLRDLGGLGEGDRVLVIGAGGGVGSISIGIGKRLGAHVTGVCGAKDVDRVRELGADEVIDRSTADPLTAETGYDVVFDTPAAYSYGQCSSSLRPGGAYVTTLPDAALITGRLASVFSSKRCHFVQVASRRKDLELVGDWLADGLELSIDSRHKIADLDQALERQAAGDRTGRVAVDVADGWI